MSLSTSSLFRRALNSASKASSLPTIEDKTQELVESALRDLEQLNKRLGALSLFSSNESLDDVGTKDMVYMFVPYVFAEVENGARVGPDFEDRVRRLSLAERYLKEFIARLSDYEIIPEDERSLYSKNVNPGERRDVKIKQFKKEKEIKTRISALHKKGLLDANSATDYDLIASLLPNSEKTDDEDDEDDNLRKVTLLLLRLCWAKAQTQLESMRQELGLISTAPRPESRVPTEEKTPDSTWKLDLPLMTGGPDGKGPIFDAKGKLLRPVTIVSSKTERERLQEQVFQPDHRLPTMSIDEYLEEERRRGNIITGGGAKSLEAPTSKEQLAMDSEMDGTLQGEERAEQKRREEEEWALFTEDNPKGAGNTMNRG